MSYKVNVAENIFYDVIGQERVKDILSSLEESGNVGHAYVFNGPVGIGRKMIAGKFASMLMCLREHKKGSVCCECESCMLLKNGTNPDIIPIGVPKDKKSISVESVRNMREDMLTAPLISKKKVYVIENGDKMTVEAQNALLKILEEPPHYVVILILSSNPLILLDTVRSRTVRIDFSRNSEDEIKIAYRRMRNGVVDDDEEALVCAYADGIIGRVYDFGDGEEVRNIREKVLDAMCGLYRGGFDERKRLSAVLSEKGEDSDFVMFTLISFYRDIVHLVRFGKNAKLQNKEYKNRLYDMGRDIGYHNAIRCIRIIDDAWKNISRNAAYKLAIEDMIIKLQEVMAV
ncbi:MAG: DNA polymerase III subunit delta' [Ruminococcaceae bacterium]|nr:DNA polymerase III subunit delta' [Oscillospiraceae bacterium]